MKSKLSSVFLAGWFIPDDHAINGIFSTKEKAMTALGKSGLKIVLPDAPLTQEQHEMINTMIKGRWFAKAAEKFMMIQEEANKSGAPFTYGIYVAMYPIDEENI